MHHLLRQLLLNVVQTALASGGLDQCETERVEEDCETEGFQAAKHICNLADWRLNDGYDWVSTKSSKA